MSSPELPRPDENPFKSPRQPAKFTLPQAPDDPERRRRRRIMLTLLGVVLVPIAAVIGGFVGCFTGLAALDRLDNEGWGIVLILVAISVGAITGAGLTIYLLVRAAKRP